MVSKSGGIIIFFSAANFLSAWYFECQDSISSLIRLLFSCISSISRYSWVFSDSSSSFCSMRFIRQLAAYPLFFNVRLRCFIRTISSLDNPRSFSCLFKSRTDIVTSSSSLMSRQGPGDNGSYVTGQVYLWKHNYLMYNTIKLLHLHDIKLIC